MAENTRDSSSLKSPRILYVINSLGIGGAETLLYNVASEIHKNKIADIDICTLYGKGNLGEKLHSEGLRIYDFSFEHKYSCKAVAELKKLIKNGKYDIVHAHLFPSGYYAALSSFLIEPHRLIYTEHNIYNRRRKYKLLRPLENIIYNRFDKIIAVSNTVKDELKNWLPAVSKKTVVIPNAVPINACSELNKDIDILFVGRLEKVKGVDLLLDALKILNKGYKTFIVGNGAERKNLESLARNLGLHDSVVFTGARSDVKDFMCRSKIFVLPSRWEGIPLALLEAMGLGLPVIASKVGGSVEVIQHGVDGLLVTPEDTGELSRLITETLADDILRERLGCNAKVKIKERYSLEQYVDRLMEIYRREDSLCKTLCSQ